MAPLEAKSKTQTQPQKSSRARKAPDPTTRRPAQRSQAYVADSDDEDAPPQDRKLKKVNVRPTVSKGEVEVENVLPAVPAAVKVTPLESSEEETTTDEEVEHDHADQTPGVANGLKRKAETQSSSDEQSGGASGDESDTPTPKRVKAEAGSASLVDGRPHEETKDQRPAAKAPPPPKRRSAESSVAVAQPITAQPYEAPTGYVAVDMSKVRSDTVYSAASLEGKQIWHIVAPLDVPLSSITEVALDNILSGNPLLTHKGNDYVLNEDASNNDHESVFLPSTTSYAAAQQHVEKTFHLQQKITLPNLSTRQASQLTGSAAAGDVAQASVSTVRPQPRGLRMRYKPPGYGQGAPGLIGSGSGSDSGEGSPHTTAGASFQFPHTLGAYSTAEQTAGGSTTAPKNSTQTPRKRKEKQKKLEADDSISKPGPAGLGLSRGHEVSAHAATASAMEAIEPQAAGAADVVMTEGVVSDRVGKEVKARRKEERRKKKEGKVKAEDVDG